MSSRFDTVYKRLAAICTSLPEVTERPSHGTPTWFVREKKTVAQLWDDHHDDGRLAMWCPAPDGVQAAMIAEDPARFFRPPYVGPSGWLGYRFDRSIDWAEVEAIVEEAYRKVAPKTLVKLIDARP